MEPRLKGGHAFLILVICAYSVNDIHARETSLRSLFRLHSDSEDSRQQRATTEHRLSHRLPRFSTLWVEAISTSERCIDHQTSCPVCSPFIPKHHKTFCSSSYVYRIKLPRLSLTPQTHGYRCSKYRIYGENFFADWLIPSKCKCPFDATGFTNVLTEGSVKWLYITGKAAFGGQHSAVQLDDEHHFFYEQVGGHQLPHCARQRKGHHGSQHPQVEMIETTKDPPIRRFTGLLESTHQECNESCPVCLSNMTDLHVKSLCHSHIGLIVKRASPAQSIGSDRCNISDVRILRVFYGLAPRTKSLLFTTHSNCSCLSTSNNKKLILLIPRAMHTGFLEARDKPIHLNGDVHIAAATETMRSLFRLKCPSTEDDTHDPPGTSDRKLLNRKRRYANFQNGPRSTYEGDDYHYFRPRSHSDGPLSDRGPEQRPGRTLSEESEVKQAIGGGSFPTLPLPAGKKEDSVDVKKETGDDTRSGKSFLDKALENIKGNKDKSVEGDDKKIATDLLSGVFKPTKGDDKDKTGTDDSLKKEDGEGSKGDDDKKDGEGYGPYPNPDRGYGYGGGPYRKDFGPGYDRFRYEQGYRPPYGGYGQPYGEYAYGGNGYGRPKPSYPGNYGRPYPPPYRPGNDGYNQTYPDKPYYGGGYQNYGGPGDYGNGYGSYGRYDFNGRYGYPDGYGGYNGGYQGYGERSYGYGRDYSGYGNEYNYSGAPYRYGYGPPNPYYSPKSNYGPTYDRDYGGYYESDRYGGYNNGYGNGYSQGKMPYDNRYGYSYGYSQGKMPYDNRYGYSYVKRNDYRQYGYQDYARDSTEEKYKQINKLAETEQSSQLEGQYQSQHGHLNISRDGEDDVHGTVGGNNGYRFNQTQSEEYDEERHRQWGMEDRKLTKRGRVHRIDFDNIEEDEGPGESDTFNEFETKSEARDEPDTFPGSSLESYIASHRTSAPDSFCSTEPPSCPLCHLGLTDDPAYNVCRSPFVLKAAVVSPPNPDDQLACGRLVIIEAYMKPFPISRRVAYSLAKDCLCTFAETSYEHFFIFSPPHVWSTHDDQYNQVQLNQDVLLIKYSRTNEYNITEALNHCRQVAEEY